MIVVSDTSVLNYLIQLRLEEVLYRLFNEVIVPPSVVVEMYGSPARTRFIDLLAQRKISTGEIKNTLLFYKLRETLGKGESEAIVLALELNADFLLIDERLGNTTAKQQGLRTTGLLGILIDAKKAGYISDVKSALEQLKEETNFHITNKLFQIVLALAGET